MLTAAVGVVAGMRKLAMPAILGYLAVGIIWIVSFYRRKPAVTDVIREDLERSHARFKEVSVRSA